MAAVVELMVVGGAVTAALAWAGRAGWRSWRKQGVCSSCGSSGECPVADNPEALAEIRARGQLSHLDSCQPGTLSCEDLAQALETREDLVTGSPGDKLPKNSHPDPDRTPQSR
jgi:hypothetical protein